MAYNSSDDVEVVGCLAAVVMGLICGVAFFFLFANPPAATKVAAYPWIYREGCIEVRDSEMPSIAPGVYCIVEIR